MHLLPLSHHLVYFVQPPCCSEGLPLECSGCYELPEVKRLPLALVRLLCIQHAEQTVSAGAWGIGGVPPVDTLLWGGHRGLKLSWCYVTTYVRTYPVMQGNSLRMCMVVNVLCHCMYMVRTLLVYLIELVY